jgi:N-acetylglucosaminyldiphosphoundecaprenol N-acetyl-beta-D-mannosaminyltransferase
MTLDADVNVRLAPVMFGNNTEMFSVLGVRIGALQITDVIERMQAWISQRDGSHFIAVVNVHVVMEAQHDPSFRRVLETADLRVPDGMPLVWVGRARGHQLQRRVYGPDLLVDFCQHTQDLGYRHFFYGGAPGVPEALTKSLKQKFPGLNVVGSYSPPFRHLTAEEDSQEVEMIRVAKPDVLWVGLGCPKQERWISEHLDRLGVPIMVGVGQAFDIHSGRSKQAPSWLREHGLEWLYRLVAEPRRLWRRYLLYNSQFIVCESLEILGLKRFGEEEMARKSALW